MQKLRRAFSTHKDPEASATSVTEKESSPPPLPTSSVSAVPSRSGTNLPRKRLSLFVKTTDSSLKPRSLSDVSDAEDFTKVQKRKSLFARGTRHSKSPSAASSPASTLNSPRRNLTTGHNRHTMSATISSPLPSSPRSPLNESPIDPALTGGANSLAVPLTKLASNSEPNLTTANATGQANPGFSRSGVRPSIRRVQSQRKSHRVKDGETLQEPDASASPESQADDYLQLGMQFHERGELEKATHYWRMAAERDSPLGLFFYGIALRHGWGCKANPSLAVHYLQKAAESAVFDLHTGIARNVSIARSELVLAIYELGVCFRHGWGVPKNKETAAYYFEIAANLGDPDAQNDLAFCYVHGHGVKKDPFRAAKYYRMAAKQGSGIMGNSWIYKKKYDVVEEKEWEATHTSQNVLAHK